MRRSLIPFSLCAALAGCHGLTATGLEPALATTTSYQEAYNEHVELNVGGVATQVKVNGEAVAFFRQGGRVFFDLPQPPFPFSGLPDSASAYTSRGAVTVEVAVTNRATPFTQTYQPYGAVESGQVNLLLPLQGLEGGCPASGFFQGFGIVASSVSTGGPLAQRLCFLTLNIEDLQSTSTLRRGTKQAVAYLAERLTNELSIDRNVLLSPDGHRPALSYDPGCEQLERWLGNENSDKRRIDAAAILAETNAATAHARGIFGANVRVAVMGGGVDASVLSNPKQVVLSPNQNFVEPGKLPLDEFACDFGEDGSEDFRFHDTHVAEVIGTIAPEAVILPLKVCDHDGNCPSSAVVRALMYLENSYSGVLLVNLSAGSPLRSDAVFRFLETDANRPNESFFLVASTGNNGQAVTHYPATLSPASAPPGSSPAESLQNVVSVAAYGVTTKGAYALALFNTRQNSDVFGLGINLCLPSVTLQCQGSSGPGIGGTSFSAPMVAGVAALYAQAQPGANLYGVLTGNARLLPGATLGKVWYQ